MGIIEAIIKCYSPERKAAVSAKLLPPYNITVSLQNHKDRIFEVTLYNWRNQAGLEGKSVPIEPIKLLNNPQVRLVLYLCLKPSRLVRWH